MWRKGKSAQNKKYVNTIGKEEGCNLLQEFLNIDSSLVSWKENSKKLEDLLLHRNIIGFFFFVISSKDECLLLAGSNSQILLH